MQGLLVRKRSVLLVVPFVAFVVGAVEPARHIRDRFRSPHLNGLRPRLRLLASGHNPIHPDLLEWGSRTLKNDLYVVAYDLYEYNFSAKKGPSWSPNMVENVETQPPRICEQQH